MYEKLRYIKLTTGAELLGIKDRDYPNHFRDLLKIELLDNDGIFLKRYTKFSSSIPVEINPNQIIVTHDCTDQMENFYYTSLNIIKDYDDYIEKSLETSVDFINSMNDNEDTVKPHKVYQELLAGWDVDGLRPN